MNLLDTSVAQLPEPVANAIEEERIQDVLTNLKSEILAIDPETEVTVDVGQPVAKGGRVRLGSLLATCEIIPSLHINVDTILNWPMMNDMVDQVD